MFVTYSNFYPSLIFVSKARKLIIEWLMHDERIIQFMSFKRQVVILAGIKEVGKEKSAQREREGERQKDGQTDRQTER